MYVLNITQNGETRIKILESNLEYDFTDNKSEDLDRTPFQIGGELLVLVLNAIKNNENVDKYIAEYKLSDFEIRFISALIGEIKDYAFLVEYNDNCGKSDLKHLGFWVLNNLGDWVAIENFCNGKLIMGYVKPCEIIQYLTRFA